MLEQRLTDCCAINGTVGTLYRKHEKQSILLCKCRYVLCVCVCVCACMRVCVVHLIKQKSVCAWFVSAELATAQVHTHTPGPQPYCLTGSAKAPKGRHGRLCMQHSMCLHIPQVGVGVISIFHCTFNTNTSHTLTASNIRIYHPNSHSIYCMMHRHCLRLKHYHNYR